MGLEDGWIDLPDVEAGEPLSARWLNIVSHDLRYLRGLVSGPMQGQRHVRRLIDGEYHGPPTNTYDPRVSYAGWIRHRPEGTGLKLKIGLGKVKGGNSVVEAKLRIICQVYTRAATGILTAGTEYEIIEDKIITIAEEGADVDLSVYDLDGSYTYAGMHTPVTFPDPLADYWLQIRVEGGHNEAVTQDEFDSWVYYVAEELGTASGWSAVPAVTDGATSNIAWATAVWTDLEWLKDRMELPNPAGYHLQVEVSTAGGIVSYHKYHFQYTASTLYWRINVVNGKAGTPKARIKVRNEAGTVLATSPSEDGQIMSVDPLYDQNWLGSLSLTGLGMTPGDFFTVGIDFNQPTVTPGQPLPGEEGEYQPAADIHMVVDYCYIDGALTEAQLAVPGETWVAPGTWVFSTDYGWGTTVGAARKLDDIGGDLDYIKAAVTTYNLAHYSWACQQHDTDHTNDVLVNGDGLPFTVDANAKIAFWRYSLVNQHRLAWWYADAAEVIWQEQVDPDPENTGGSGRTGIEQRATMDDIQATETRIADLGGLGFLRAGLLYMVDGKTHFWIEDIR